MLAGAIWQQNGFLSELGRQFPALTYITDYYSNLGHGGYNGWSSPWPVAPRRWGVELQTKVHTKVCNHREGPTRAFSWLKAPTPTTAFTIKILLRLYYWLLVGKHSVFKNLSCGPSFPALGRHMIRLNTITSCAVETSTEMARAGTVAGPG